MSECKDCLKYRKTLEDIKIMTIRCWDSPVAQEEILNNISKALGNFACCCHDYYSTLCPCDKYKDA